jgi:hypothetical protein
MNIYTENGFDTRRAYLDSLVDQFGLERSTVYDLASILGPDEDFDGLVTSLEDYESFDDYDMFDEWSLMAD